MSGKKEKMVGSYPCTSYISRATTTRSTLADIEKRHHATNGRDRTSIYSRTQVP